MLDFWRLIFISAVVPIAVIDSSAFAQNEAQDAYRRQLDCLYVKPKPAHCGQPAAASDFDPATSADHSCKRSESPIGSPVEMWVCVVERGNVISMTGDLLAVAYTRGDRSYDVGADCQSTYTPAREFAPKTFRSGGIALRVTPEKRYSAYIIDPQLGTQSRESWRRHSTNVCQWTVEERKQKQEWEGFADVLKAVPYCYSPNGQRVDC